MHIERSISKRKKQGMEWAYSFKQQHGLHAPIGHGHAHLATQRNSQHRPHATNLSKSDGGQDSAIHRKGKVSVEQERTPYNMTCNYLPWLPIQDLEIRKAFHNRCFFFMT